MNIQCYHDSTLDLPQFQIVPDESDTIFKFEYDSIYDINYTIQNVAESWPRTREMFTGDNPYGQVCAAQDVLYGCQRSANVNRGRTVDELKDDVEIASGIKMSQGFYLVAAKLSAWKIKPTRDRSSFYINLRLNPRYFKWMNNLGNDENVLAEAARR